MPQRGHTTKDEELAVLRKQLQSAQQELKTTKIELAKTQSKRPKKLIPRPKGQAGRRSGYNLIYEMRLSGNKPRYNRLQTISRHGADRFLDITKTISGQDKSRLQKTIQWIAKEAHYFQRFEGFWPIHAFLKQYLSNLQDKYKKTIRTERDAEANDTDDWSAAAQGGGGGDEEEEAAGSEDDINAANDDEINYSGEDNTGDHENDDFNEFYGSDGGREDEPEFDFERGNFGERDEHHSEPEDPSPPKKNKENISPKKDAQMPLKTRPKPKPMYNNENSANGVLIEPVNSKTVEEGSLRKAPVDVTLKRKSPDTGKDEEERSLKKARVPTDTRPKSANDESESSQRHKKTGSDSPLSIPQKLRRADIPTTCPATYCKDAVPDYLPPQIFALFARKHELVSTKGPTTPGCRELTREICRSIKEYQHRLRSFIEAESAGWPLQIDFEELPARIVLLLPQLSALQCNHKALASSPVWREFLSRIGYKVFSFSRSTTKFFEQGFLGCGYFGPKGQSIIEETLSALVLEEDVEHDLFQTLNQLVDTPTAWDNYDNTSNLITVSDFTQFVLVPSIATELIAQDLEIPLDHALQVLKSSREYGYLANDSPAQVENVEVNATPKKSSSSSSQVLPPRSRKVNLVLPKKEIITLDNFPAPPTVTYIIFIVQSLTNPHVWPKSKSKAKTVKTRKPKKQELKVPKPAAKKSAARKKTTIDSEKPIESHKYGTRSHKAAEPDS